MIVRLLTLPDRPTAVFGSNDEIAAGVLAAAKSSGMNVPYDLSIAGFEDSPFSKQSWPALTTAKQATQDIARHAAHRLLQEIREHAPKSAAPNEGFSPELVVRGHCTPSTWEIAEPVPEGPTVPRLVELARRYGMFLSVGMSEKERDIVYNTQVLWFPEVPRIVALKGADVILMPHAAREKGWDDTPESEAAARRHVHHFFASGYAMRARENACFCVYTDQAGRA